MDYQHERIDVGQRWYIGGWVERAGKNTSRPDPGEKGFSASFAIFFRKKAVWLGFLHLFFRSAALV
jgi:hypothetical protein